MKARAPARRRGVLEGNSLVLGVVAVEVVAVEVLGWNLVFARSRWCRVGARDAASIVDSRVVYRYTKGRERDGKTEKPDTRQMERETG